jgi:biopolymer transport protein ExbD
MASPVIKRQRKRKRIDTDGDPEFQVAPMVDVLLVLMLFFMAITSTEVLKKVKNVQLADAKNAKPDTHTHKNEILVNVEWSGVDNVATFSLDGVSYSTADSMEGILAARHDQNPGAYVVIRADRSAEYSYISDLMTTCAKAGISTVSFAVLIGGNKQAPAVIPGSGAAN